MEQDNNKSENSFFSFVLFFVLFLSSFLAIFSSSITQEKQASIPTPKSTVALSETEDVLASSKRNYDAPTIYISGGDGYGSGGVIPLASTDEPAVYIASYSYSGEVEISLYRGDEQSLLDYLTHNKDNAQLKKKPDVSKFSLVTTIKQSIASSGFTNTVKTLLPLEENGIWFLQMKTAKSEEYAFVVRSDYGVLAKEGDHRLVFWAQSFKTKRKISGGKIKLYNLLNQVTVLEENSFDGDGIAASVLNPDIDIVIAEFDGKVAVIPINLRYMDRYNYRSFRAKEVPTKYFIFTDRPIYQPGDTVYFKAILRDDDDARYSIPQGTAKVKIYKDWDEKNNLVYENTLSITNSGSVYGEYKIPKDINTGDYQLKVDTGKTSSVGDWTYSGSSVSFEIQYYRKPEYTIDIETAQKELIAKGKLNFTIKGNYFSGQPLSGIVQYSIAAADFYSYEYFNDYNSFGNEDYYWWGYGSKKFEENVATFDEKGEARVEIEARDSETAGKNKIFTIEALFDNGSGNPVFARKNVLVYAGEFDIFRKDYGFGSQVNKEISLPIILKPHWNAKISQIPLKIKVRRENWVAKWNKDEKYPSYEKETENFPDLRLTTDNNGESTIKFTPSKVGSYVFSVEAADARGNLVKRDFHTWVTDKDYSYNYSQYENQLTVKGDKDKYNPGETVNLAIYSEVPDRDIFLSFERGRMDRFQIVSLTGKSALVQIPLSATDLPNIYATISSFSDFALDSGSTNISVSTEGKKIIVNLTPDRKMYGPGDTVNLNVETLDTAGNPVPSEVAVWAVDKALFELVDQKPGKIFDTFWKERWNDTLKAHSLEGIIILAAESGGCFSGETKILLADGKEKAISEIKAGEYILTKEKEQTPKLVKAKVKSVHKAEVAGYLIINRDLRVTENHFLWVNKGWKEAGSIQIGDELVDKNGQKLRVNSLEWIRGKFIVYNLEVEKHHTFFAGGVFAHNQKGGGGRTVFKDAAYWNPTVQTDGSGRAKVTFKLPDNLTTWVLAGIAASNETRVGQSTNEIVVNKNVIVRPILPNIIRIGDVLSVSALVQNFTEVDQNFDVSLDFDSGTITEPKQTTVLIKSRETKQISWQIEPQKESEKAAFVFSAVSKENQENFDKITSEIPVLQFGFRQKIGMAGEGNKEFEVKLSPDVDKSKSQVNLSFSSNLHGSLLSAMRYLIYYPYGCVEQITSAFVPAVVVKENPSLFKNYLEDQDLDKIINDSVKKLAKLQKSDGSWSWWAQKDSNYFVTAYVVEYLSRAKKLGYDDNGTLSRAMNLLRIKSNLIQNNEILKTYGLGFVDESNRKGVTITYNDPRLTVDVLALGIINNIRSGNNDPQTNGLNQLVSLAKQQGEEVYFEKGSRENFGSIEASTALAVRAMIAGGAERSLVTKAVRYLMRSRRFDYWANSFATAQVIQAIAGYAGSASESSPDYSFIVSLDGENLRSGKVTSSQQTIGEITIPGSEIKDSGSKVLISKQGEGQIYSTLVIDEWHTDKNSKAESHDMNVTREYLDKDYGSYKIIGLGDEVTVKLIISGLKTDENFAVLTDELPSGLVPINETFANEQFSKTFPYDDCYVSEITKNGVVLSLYNVKEGENICQYRARAVVQGKFLVPPAEASLMYSPEIWGRTSVETIEIKGSKSVTPRRPKDYRKLAAKKGILILKYLLGGVTLFGLGFGIWKFSKKSKNVDIPPPPTPPLS